MCEATRITSALLQSHLEGAQHKCAIKVNCRLSPARVPLAMYAVMSVRSLKTLLSVAMTCRVSNLALTLIVFAGFVAYSVGQQSTTSIVTVATTESSVRWLLEEQNGPIVAQLVLYPTRI